MWSLESVVKDCAYGLQARLGEGATAWVGLAETFDGCRRAMECQICDTYFQLPTPILFERSSLLVFGDLLSRLIVAETARGMGAHLNII